MFCSLSASLHNTAAKSAPDWTCLQCNTCSLFQQQLQLTDNSFRALGIWSSYCYIRKTCHYITFKVHASPLLIPWLTFNNARHVMSEFSICSNTIWISTETDFDLYSFCGESVLTTWQLSTKQSQHKVKWIPHTTSAPSQTPKHLYMGRQRRLWWISDKTSKQNTWTYFCWNAIEQSGKLHSQIASHVSNWRIHVPFCRKTEPKQTATSWATFGL